MVNFPSRMLGCDSHSPALLDLIISSDTSICSTMAFPPLENFDSVVASVSIDLLSNSQQDALFHRVAYEYSGADWDGLHDHLRDVQWEDIFNVSAFAAASKFWFGYRLQLMYIYLIENMRPSLTHLHGFQLLLLLPLFIEITFLFVPKG